MVYINKIITVVGTSKNELTLPIAMQVQKIENN